MTWNANVVVMSPEIWKQRKAKVNMKMGMENCVQGMESGRMGCEPHKDVWKRYSAVDAAVSLTSAVLWHQ